MFRSASAADDGRDVGAASVQGMVSAPAVGRFQIVTGLVTVTRANFAHQAIVGNPVYEGDLIETGVDGLVAIAFMDGTTFHLQADARLVVDEFICGAEKSSGSARLRLINGAFGLVAGKLATTGRLIIDTPFAQIRGTAPGVGIGSLTVALLTFGLIRELDAHPADPAYLDDGHINYKDLPHGVFAVHFKGDPAHGIPPQDIVVDDPGVTVVMRLRGSGLSVQEVVNNPSEMSALQSAYNGALSTFLQGQEFVQHYQHADVTPQSTGNDGSSTPPNELVQPDNPPVVHVSLGTGSVSGAPPSNGPTTPTAPTPIVVPPPPPPPPIVLDAFSHGTIDFSDNASFAYSGPQISSNGSTLTLTNGNIGEYGTWFSNNVYSIDSFTASFDYQAIGQADGIAFILQDDPRGSSALGTNFGSNGGSGLGYAGISPSAAVEFNIFTGHVQGTNFATDGSTGNYNPTGEVAFWNGDEIQVVLTYNGSVLTETLTDLVNHATYSASYTENLEQILGSDTAYVGFSAGTGAEASTQTVSNFTFEDGTVSAPAGVAGSPINLALANPLAANGKSVAIAVTGVPADWKLNEGTNLGNGTWTAQTDDLSALTVLTAATYAGAMMLGVTETWANADGTTGTAFVSDNVEAYAPGAPIFAWSGEDTLTSAGGNDLFVFAQPIGNDTIYNFNVASDQIDLTGFTGITSFGDLAGHIAGDGNGDTVITLGVGETITLHGIDPASLAANDFVFDQTPILDNAGTMTVNDGAMLPLGGIIENTGTIALNSSGDATELQIVGDGITLDGGGQVVLSDSSENMIVGTNADATLVNVDNTISGAGQFGIGDGNLTLVNETAGIIDANYADVILTIDTGNTIVNAGLLEATNGGTLQIIDSVANSGTLAANGGTLMADGNVTGSGEVVIADGGNADFAGTLDQNVTFTGPGVLELDHSQSYGGTMSSFATGDTIDLNDLTYSPNETFAWTQDSGGGVLTIDDNGTTENILLDGNYTQGEFALTQDATLAAGTDVVSVPSVDSTAVSGTDDVAGNISFADSNVHDALSASVTPESSGYVGSFSVDAVTDNNGNESVGFEFMSANDQINLAPGQTLSQSYNVTVADVQNPAGNVTQTVSVSIGGSGNDNFVFAPGIGADTIVNFDPQHDTIELDHFANAQTVQELQSLITTDAHGDAVIDLGHNDSITLPGMSPAQLHAALQSVVHLH
jgi:Legume lectin domain